MSEAQRQWELLTRLYPCSICGAPVHITEHKWKADAWKTYTYKFECENGHPQGQVSQYHIGE